MKRIKRASVMIRTWTYLGLFLPFVGFSQMVSPDIYLVDYSSDGYGLHRETFFERDSIIWQYVPRQDLKGSNLAYLLPKTDSTSAQLMQYYSSRFDTSSSFRSMGSSGWPIQYDYTRARCRIIVHIEEHHFTFKVKRIDSGELWLRKRNRL